MRKRVITVNGSDIEDYNEKLSLTNRFIKA